MAYWHEVYIIHQEFLKRQTVTLHWIDVSELLLHGDLNIESIQDGERNMA